MTPVTTAFRSGPRVELDMEGLKGASGRLKDIAERGEDMRPAMLKIKGILEEGHRKQFASKGSFLDSPWPENSPATLARKAAQGQGSEAMVASGALKTSLEGGKGRRSRVSRSSVSVGTSLFYAVFHINPKRKGMPARPPVGINESQRRAALEIMERHVLRGAA